MDTAGAPVLLMLNVHECLTDNINPISMEITTGNLKTNMPPYVYAHFKICYKIWQQKNSQ